MGEEESGIGRGALAKSIFEDLKRAGELCCVGEALARFAIALSPTSQFEFEGKQWVLRPDNFVTLHVQVRNPIIVMTFSGHPAQFRERSESFGLSAEYATLEASRTSHSSYKITSASQLLVAAQFLKWGHEYKTRNRKRVVK
jgi:hypothetical protein